MRVWKKTLSMVLALSLALSLIVLPASAAGGMTVSVSEATAKAGESFTLDLSVADNTAFQALTVYVYYPKELTCSSVNAVGADWRAFMIANLGDGTITAEGNPNDTTNNDRDDKNMASFGYVASTSNVPGFTNGTIGSLTFTSAADADSMNAEIEVVVVKASDANGDIAANGSTSHVTIQGAPASIKSLTLDPAEVEVNGTDVTVTATALSTKDKPMSAALSVEPESDDVTVGNGRIIVNGKAKAGSYTVTATDEQGKTATATLTVTRADPVITTVEITNGSTFTIPKTGASTLTFAAEVKDQFGDRMNEQVTWNVTASAETGLTIDGNKVTVSSDAVKDTIITATATAGGKTGSKEVRLVNIELTVTPKTDAAYGDTWTEILPVSGMTAKMGDQNLTITSAARTINGKNVDAVKPVPGAYSVDVTVQTAEGEATVTVPVTVGKRAITVELKNQTFTYDGEEHAAGNVTDKGDVAGEDLVFVPVKEVKATDAGVYAVEYTCESELYNATATGGALVIKPQPVEVTDKSPLESIKLFGDTEVECTIDKKTGKVTLDVTVSPDNVKSETRVLDMLEDATGDVKLSIRVDGTKYEYTIKGWALKDEEFKSGKTNTFVATGFVPVKDGVAGNYAPDLGEIEFIVRVSRSSGGGAGGGASTGWDWGDRGNQTINLTPQSIFTDVPDGHTFQKDIVWVYYRGIMKGTTETTFSPASSTNRQQLWMVLGRISGSSPADMAMAREWAVNTGVSDGSKPTGSLTRQQMVTMLYRWAQSKGYVGVTTGSIAGYNDASSVASYAKDAMTWAVGNGIINGSGNNLNPGGTATRGQFAAIMHRFCEKFGV